MKRRNFVKFAGIGALSPGVVIARTDNKPTKKQGSTCSMCTLTRINLDGREIVGMSEFQGKLVIATKLDGLYILDDLSGYRKVDGFHEISEK